MRNEKITFRYYMILYVSKFNGGLTRGVLTARKMKFSTKDFFSKCDQIRRKL